MRFKNVNYGFERNVIESNLRHLLLLKGLRALHGRLLRGELGGQCHEKEVSTKRNIRVERAGLHFLEQTSHA
jgi:hypothetical protein